MTEQDFKNRWSELHGGADTEGVVGGWLSFSYQAARVCVALRISPNALTFLGLGRSSLTASMAVLQSCEEAKASGANSLIHLQIASLKPSGFIWGGA
jgi:hypothetical protein